MFEPSHLKETHFIFLHAICDVNIEECNENESANSRHDFIIQYNQLLGGVRIAAHILTASVQETLQE